jgi:hypothetical protein
VTAVVTVDAAGARPSPAKPSPSTTRPAICGSSPSRSSPEFRAEAAAMGLIPQRQTFSEEKNA